MPARIPVLIGTVVALTSVRPLSAQTPPAHDIAGTWAVEFDQSVRTDASGAVSTGNKGRARLVLTRQGDSVSGVWQAIPAAGGGTPAPRQLRGVVAGDSVRLSSQTSVRTSRNGAESVQTATQTYEFVITGSTLRGSLGLILDGTSPVVRPLTGVRESAP